MNYIYFRKRKTFLQGSLVDRRTSDIIDVSPIFSFLFALSHCSSLNLSACSSLDLSLYFSVLCVCLPLVCVLLLNRFVCTSVPTFRQNLTLGNDQKQKKKNSVTIVTIMLLFSLRCVKLLTQ